MEFCNMDDRVEKGAFYTPKIWVDKSQEYLARIFGEDWQDNYYIWDCAAGIGNLLIGLKNKNNVWASTIDQQDIDLIYEKIDKDHLQLYKDNTFQFDFLNDSFDKLPEGLRDVILDPEKQKKLIMYINPPYVDHAGFIQSKRKPGLTKKSLLYNEFLDVAGAAICDIFTHFFLRIYKYIPQSKLAVFCKMKYINSQHFLKFRQYFKVDYMGGFVCPANTFEGVVGRFPIGFLIWNLENRTEIEKVNTDVFVHNENLTLSKKIGNKNYYNIRKEEFLSEWLRTFQESTQNRIGYLRRQGSDIQTANQVFLTSLPSKSDIDKRMLTDITYKNLIEICVYFAVRHCIKKTWLNSQDQFLYPNKSWEQDIEFQNDCLIFTLFHGSNRICKRDGANFIIPFIVKNNEVQSNINSFLQITHVSKEAVRVYDVAENLWNLYYDKTGRVDSLYEIKEWFCGRTNKGILKSKSHNIKFNNLCKELRVSLKILGMKIQKGLYNHRFLKR
jgi:hypothetical protein